GRRPGQEGGKPTRGGHRGAWEQRPGVAGRPPPRDPRPVGGRPGGGPGRGGGGRRGVVGGGRGRWGWGKGPRSRPRGRRARTRRQACPRSGSWAWTARAGSCGG